MNVKEILKTTVNMTKKAAKSSRCRCIARGIVGAGAMVGTSVAIANFTGKRTSTARKPASAMLWATAGVAGIVATSMAAGNFAGSIVPALLCGSDEEYDDFRKYAAGQHESDDDDDFESEINEMLSQQDPVDPFKFSPAHAAPSSDDDGSTLRHMVGEMVD